MHQTRNHELLFNQLLEFHDFFPDDGRIFHFQREHVRFGEFRLILIVNPLIFFLWVNFKKVAE